MLKLTDGEKLFLARRRKGLDQLTFAYQHGVKQPTVAKWERGDLKYPGKVPDPGRVTENERAVLLRRRLGLNARDAAKAAGWSRIRVLRYEHGKPDNDKYLVTLESLWCERG